MRVTKRLHGEERGAVMMIVAISLFVLVGMLVLTVDLGRMVAVRREMVRAADAAALAAAQECAFGNGSGAATSAASQIAGTNHAGASLVPPGLIFVLPGECDDPTLGGAKLVTVNVTTSLNMFFAPIFGVDESSVTAQATATWATPGTVPIAIFLGPLEACEALDSWESGQTECTIEYPMDALEQPRWGVLGVTPEFWAKDADCKLDANWVNSIISGGGIWPLPEPPPDQWACIDNGVQSSTWNLLPVHTYWFPVVNLDLSKGHVVPGKPGVSCTGADIPTLELKGEDCRITRAWVIDFVKLKVLSSDPGNPPTIIVESVPSHGSIAGIEIRLVD